jgi:predicted NAD/FAD-binding protein
MKVVVYEKADRIGGLCNTVSVPLPEGETPVDTGFIVFNPQTYPNFVELLKVLGVKSDLSDMSFAVSLDGGGLEYSSNGRLGLFAQPANFVWPRFCEMLADLARFYRGGPCDLGRLDERVSLGEYLA